MTADIAQSTATAGFTYIPPHPPEDRNEKPSPEDSKFHKVVRQLLAQTFYGPMLKQMRESPFKSELFSGGKAGESFNQMLDQHLALRAAGGDSGNGGRLARAIVRQYHAIAQRNAHRDVDRRTPPSTQPAKGGEHVSVVG